MSASISIAGWQEIDQRLTQFAQHERVSLLKDIGVEMEAQTRERIDESKAPDGSAWTPWAEATEKYVRRYARGSRMLRRSGSGGGRLYERIASTVRGGDAVIVGVDVPYGEIHQEGGNAGRGLRVRIPARPYLGTSKENEQEIQSLIREWVQERL